MEYTKNFLILFLLIFITVPNLSAGEAVSVKLSPSDKCAVCGMFVSRYPKWVAEIIFRDGTYAVFDGARDMLKYYYNLNTYNPGKNISDIVAVYATEYYSAKLMPAEKLLFIKGSDIYGPMGEEIIPVDGEGNANEFMKDHRGKKIMRFKEITMEDIK